MPASTPPRKFAPTPIEETTKSTRQRSPATEEKPKPRRFAPEPIEESTKSSKDVTQKTTEAEKPKPRRFAPQPVEHTTKSSKDVAPQATEQEKSKPRRFAPQLVDESEKSSKDIAKPDKKPHIKFKPEPIATTYGSNRKAKRRDGSTSSSTVEVKQEKKPPRKFTPILLDTATRSRRAGDPNAPISQDYRTEYGYHAHPREHWRRVNGQMTPIALSEDRMDVDTEEDDHAISPPFEHSSPLRRQVSPLDGSPGRRPDCLKPSRTHSFRMPDLDTIESSESEDESNHSSSPVTPAQEGSPITVSDSSYELFKHATRRRESIDETFTHYLLDIERKKAQERLEEQALAAFPNADFGYENPTHYFNEDDDADDIEIEERPVTWEGNDDDLLEMARRESTANISWEQRELQKYAENKQQERTAAKSTDKQQATKSPWIKLDTVVGAAEDDSELKSMRDRARPPMLGSEIVFPRCRSPDPARFDVTQGATALRKHMQNLEEAAENDRKSVGDDGGLWKVKQPESKPPTAVESPVSAKPSSPKGLWGGFCVDEGGDSNAPSRGGGISTPTKPTGLMTPKQDAPNPFQLALDEGRPVGLVTPSTPLPKSNVADMQRLNAILVTEREIDAMVEREYPDEFITQVYNYLSLGYPSLARPFDEELSKISRIPISELQQDDQKAKASPRGYIRLGPDFEGGGGEGMTEDSCMRWQALKRYVREWAKQEKNFQGTDGVGGNWGTGARRGSWAI